MKKVSRGVALKIGILRGGILVIENFKTYFNVPYKPIYKYHNDTEAVKQRLDMAKEQSRKTPIPYSKVYAYINEFLEECRSQNGFTGVNNKVDIIDLQGNKNIVLDNGIIAKGCTWIENIWDDQTKRYTQFDSKYYSIQQKFGLSHSKNILWFKFTEDGYLGVVARGQDIGFNYNNFPGQCINNVSKSWDKSFVFVFPLTKDILGSRDPDEIENAVGNYLIAKGVPIIDFYSHNY